MEDLMLAGFTRVSLLLAALTNIAPSSFAQPASAPPASAPPASAQPVVAPAREIALYPGVAPGSEKWTWSERVVTTPAGMPMVQNVVHPVLLFYPAAREKAVGTAVIVAPGGGFRNLMMSYEGADIAKYLNDLGIDAFVLKYRLTYTAPAGAGAGATAAMPDPQAGQDVRALGGADGQQAVRVVRQRAAEFGIRPDRIGMIGYSAGGAVLLSAVCGPAEARPNFAAPIYAAGAGTALPPAGAPPLFIAVAADDQAVGYQGSLDLFSAWRKAEIPVELHVFQTGRHGFAKKGGGADHYMDRFAEWLKLNGWLTRPGM
jgi:acetyl esterase/lipase